MSGDANIALLREIYAEWGRGEFKRVDIFDANVEFVTTGIDSRTYHGVEGLVKGWYDFLGAWNDFRVDTDQILTGAHPDSYVVFVHLSGIGKESGVPTQSEAGNAIWFRDGKIVRMELHWDRDATLETVGLPTPR
jgi:ketosteroid isomerase-like protein